MLKGLDLKKREKLAKRILVDMRKISEIDEETRRKIYEERLAGATYKSLEKKYDISYDVIINICRKVERHERLMQEKYYQILLSLTDDQNMIIRAVNVLERYGLNSVDAITKVTRYQLLKCRSCGVATADLILKIAERIHTEQI